MVFMFTWFRVLHRSSRAFSERTRPIRRHRRSRHWASIITSPPLEDVIWLIVIVRPTAAHALANVRPDHGVVIVTLAAVAWRKLHSSWRPRGSGLRTRARTSPRTPSYYDTPVRLTHLAYNFRPQATDNSFARQKRQSANVADTPTAGRISRILEGGLTVRRKLWHPETHA